MDIAKNVAVGFDRVLVGRVAKAPRSQTHARATSQSRDSNIAQRGSVTPKDLSQVFVKQEYDGKSDFASASRKYTTEMGAQYTLARQNATSCEERTDENNGSDVALTDRDTQNDSEDEWNMTTSISLGISSDEPIPSIEADEEEMPAHKPKPLPYLHGAARSGKNVKSLRVSHIDEVSGTENDQEQVGDNLEYDELEEALMEESENSLLIAEDDLRDYIKHKLTVENIDTWPKEAARLYKLLYLRGLYPLMGSGRVWDFFGHPMPESIFAPKASDDKVLIKAYQNQFHGREVSTATHERTQADILLASKAIRALFHLYSRVRGLRETGQTVRIGPLIKKEIGVYLRWAEKDADLRRIGYEIGFAWPVFVIDFSKAHDAGRIVSACRKCVQKYQAKWANLGIMEYPRLITVFAIIQHVVVVLVVDTHEHETQEPIPMTEIDLSELNHWLDCAIAIAIPVMLARESLLAYRSSFPVTEMEESDPDL